MRSKSEQDAKRQAPADAEEGHGLGDVKISLGTDILALLVDTHGTIRAANAELIELIGLEAEALVGRNLSKMPAVLDIFPDRVLKEIKNAASTNEKLLLPQQSGTSQETSLVPLFSAGNEVRSIILLAKPTLGTAEGPLSGNAKTFFDLVKNIPQGVFFKDRCSVYKACNHAYGQDLGTTPREIVGKTEYDFHPTALAEKFIEQDKKAITSGVTECTEAVHFDRGEERLVYKVKSPVRGANGEIMGVLGILWDITDRKRRESHLSRTAKLQSNSLDLFAHSIREPLTVIQGYASILQRSNEHGLSTEQIDMIRSIVASAAQMAHITETFLDADRIEQTAWSLQTTLVSLDDMIHRVVERFADEALRRGLSIIVQAEPQVQVTGDDDLLMEALSVFLSNAIRYSDHGVITVSLRQTIDEAIVSIADEGRGISDEDLPYIFSKFYRIAHRDSDVEGLGLGLALAKSIVESHNGSIAVTSILGRGSTFEIRLALHAQTSSSTAQRASMHRDHRFSGDTSRT